MDIHASTANILPSRHEPKADGGLLSRQCFSQASMAWIAVAASWLFVREPLWHGATQQAAGPVMHLLVPQGVSKDFSQNL